MKHSTISFVACAVLGFLAACDASSGASATTPDTDAEAPAISDAQAADATPIDLDAKARKDIDYADLQYLKVYPNCEPGADCFGPSAICPVLDGCCGFWYAGCSCDGQGKVHCYSGSSALCDICMPKTDTWPDTSVVSPCDPTATAPTCDGDIATTCVASGGTNWLVSQGCPVYTHCSAGKCVENSGIAGKACTATTKCQGNLTCKGATPSGSGVCTAECGQCKGNKCIEWPNPNLPTIGITVCTGPWPEFGNIALHLAPCDQDADCDVDQKCLLVPAAGGLGPDLPSPVKACVPTTW